MSPRSGAASHRSSRSRSFEGESDLVEMQRLLMHARCLTDDWRYAHVGELLFSYFMVVCHLDPREHVRLWHDSAGGLIGYAILGEDCLLYTSPSPRD